MEAPEGLVSLEYQQKHDQQSPADQHLLIQFPFTTAKKCQKGRKRVRFFWKHGDAEFRKHSETVAGSAFAR
ncbi:MAG: hypothetical protein HFE75_07750 [Firmicutes bacterium]|jgi:hypothetical protein|nr:hypothetical protein [Bacillota bacterium]